MKGWMTYYYNKIPALRLTFTCRWAGSAKLFKKSVKLSIKGIKMVKMIAVIL